MGSRKRPKGHAPAISADDLGHSSTPPCEATDLNAAPLECGHRRALLSTAPGGSHVRG